MPSFPRYLNIYMLWMSTIFNIILPIVSLILLNTFITRFPSSSSLSILHFSHVRTPGFQQMQKKRVDCNLNRTFPISIPSQHDNVKNGEKKLSLGWGHEEKNSPILPSSLFSIVLPFTLDHLKLRTIEQHLENLDQIRPHPNHSTSVRGSMARANVLQREVITENFFLFQCDFVQRTLRKREVTLSRINIYIVYIIVSCHTIRIIPNAWEIVQRW